MISYYADSFYFYWNLTKHLANILREPDKWAIMNVKLKRNSYDISMCVSEACHPSEHSGPWLP